MKQVVYQGEDISLKLCTLLGLDTQRSRRYFFWIIFALQSKEELVFIVLLIVSFCFSISWACMLSWIIYCYLIAALSQPFTMVVNTRSVCTHSFYLFSRLFLLSKFWKSSFSIPFHTYVMLQYIRHGTVVFLFLRT